MARGYKRTTKNTSGIKRLEASVSEQIRKELRALGIKSYKLSDRYHSGIPDIYAMGGNWIETKCIGLLPSGAAGFHPKRFIRPGQKIELHELTEAGENTFVAIYWQFGTSRVFTLTPYWEFMRIKRWDLKTITTLGMVVKAGETFRLDRFFDRNAPGHYDPGKWWNPTFDHWSKDNPDHFEPDLDWGAGENLSGPREPFYTSEGDHSWKEPESGEEES